MYLKPRLDAGLLLQPPTWIQAIGIKLYRSADAFKCMEIETASLWVGVEWRAWLPFHYRGRRDNVLLVLLQLFQACGLLRYGIARDNMQKQQKCVWNVPFLCGQSSLDLGWSLVSLWGWQHAPCDMATNIQIKQVKSDLWSNVMMLLLLKLKPSVVSTLVWEAQPWSRQCAEDKLSLSQPPVRCLHSQSVGESVGIKKGIIMQPKWFFFQFSSLIFEEEADLFTMSMSL